MIFLQCSNLVFYVYALYTLYWAYCLDVIKVVGRKTTLFSPPHDTQNFLLSLQYIQKKLCYAKKNESIHDNAIGMYIEKYYYKTDNYGKN